MSRKAPRDDLYGVLDLDKSASQDAIKKAYRKKAKSAHPDAGGSQSAFEKISRAYMVLSAPDKRAKYDQTGEIEDGADNSGQVPLMMLSELMKQVIAQADIDVTVDVVAKMRECLDSRLRDVEQKLTHLRKDVKRLSKLASRFHSKGQRNFLRDVVTKKVAQINLAIAEGEGVARHMKAAKELLQDYSFETDAAAPSQQWAEFRFVFRPGTATV